MPFGYEVSQRIRKRVEEVFGWIKTVGNFRKTRYRGLAANQLAAHMHGAAYNLLRIAKLRQVATSPNQARSAGPQRSRRVEAARLMIHHISKIDNLSRPGGRAFLRSRLGSVP